MCIAIGCKVCRHALAIGAVGNRYVVARQDEYQRRPGCVPAHQAQALQGFCALASRLPTRERQDERALDERAASKAHCLRAGYSAATFPHVRLGMVCCTGVYMRWTGRLRPSAAQCEFSQGEYARCIHGVCTRAQTPSCFSPDLVHATRVARTASPQ